MADFQPRKSDAPPTSNAVAATLRGLARQLQKIEAQRRSSDCALDRSQSAGGLKRRETISSGIEGFDRLLPDAGFRAGTLIEWLADSGTGDQLALLAARPALGDEGFLIVIDPQKTFYPAGAAALGIDLRRLVLVRPPKPAETLWALEQSLRSRGAAVTFCPVTFCPGERLSSRVFRRLQLAAECGGGLGFLIRPLLARPEPSWSDVRLGVEPVCEGPSSFKRQSSSFKRQWRVEVLRCRGKAGKRSLLLEYDDATNLVYPLPRPAPRLSAKRA